MNIEYLRPKPPLCANIQSSILNQKSPFPLFLLSPKNGAK
jgi:hypothetical protein